jgi:hypothetical protein
MRRQGTPIADELTEGENDPKSTPAWVTEAADVASEIQSPWVPARAVYAAVYAGTSYGPQS